MITKRELLGTFKNITAIARVLDCSVAAVSVWELDEPIPAIRELQLQVKFPAMFGKPQAKELLPRLLAEQGNTGSRSARRKATKGELPRAYGT